MAVPVGLLVLIGWVVLRLWRKRHPPKEFEE
jgi:hypothetical protein